MNPCVNSESGDVAGIVNNERGFAIIVVMGMLLLLTILGATMLDSSTSDLKIAGNFRNSQESFASAEAALSFGETFADIYTGLYPGALNNTWPPSDGGVVLNSDGSPTGTKSALTGYNQIPIGNDTAFVKVELAGAGKLPAGTGNQEDAGLSPGNSLKVNNFTVTVISQAKTGSTSGQQVKLEAGIARLVQQ